MLPLFGDYCGHFPPDFVEYNPQSLCPSKRNMYDAKVLIAFNGVHVFNTHLTIRELSQDVCRISKVPRLIGCIHPQLRTPPAQDPIANHLRIQPGHLLKANVSSAISLSYQGLIMAQHGNLQQWLQAGGLGARNWRELTAAWNRRMRMIFPIPAKTSLTFADRCIE